MFTTFEIIIGLGSLLAGGVGGYGVTALMSNVITPIKYGRKLRKTLEALGPDYDKMTPEDQAAVKNNMQAAINDVQNI